MWSCECGGPLPHVSSSPLTSQIDLLTRLTMAHGSGSHLAQTGNGQKIPQLAQTDWRKIHRGDPVLCRCQSVFLSLSPLYDWSLHSSPKCAPLWPVGRGGVGSVLCYYCLCFQRVFDHGGPSGPFLFSSTFIYTKVLCFLKLYSWYKWIFFVPFLCASVSHTCLLFRHLSMY